MKILKLNWEGGFLNLPLVSCRRCGKAFISSGRGICNDCARHLDEVYAKAHEYLRDHPNERFDVHKLSYAIDANSFDIQTLVEIGWLERDIQTYSSTAASRREQAEALNRELEKLKEKNKLKTYGGEIYARPHRRY